MNSYDVAIIGGGAAGLSAALVLARARRQVAVIDAGQPRNGPAAHLQGFLSRDGMPPADLLKVGRDEVASYGGLLVNASVTGILRNVDGTFGLLLASGEPLVARRLLVATGLRDEVVDIAGVAERWGKDVLHCPYCHGHEVRDQAIGVLGGNSMAVQHALLIRQWSNDVVYFDHNTEITDEQHEQLTARAVGIIEGPVARVVVEGDRLTGVELADGRVVPRSAVFVRPSFVGNNDFLSGLAAETDAQGWAVVDAPARPPSRASGPPATP